MLKLAVIFFFVSISFAKITKNQFTLITNNNEKITEEFNSKGDVTSNLTIWVLNMNNDSLDFQRLYLANKEEKRIYKNVIAPAIKNYKLQHSTKVETASNEPSNVERKHKNHEKTFEVSNISEIKHDILILMNKLFLYQIKDPEAYNNDDVISNEKSLKLFIVGPYTSLVMTSGKLRHHYFISPPSPFPSWFYRDHKDVINNRKEKYVIFPIDVQQDFLVKLLEVLKLYTSYPV